MFWKTISSPTKPKQSRYAAKQEAVRKGAERGFGVLPMKWRILAIGCRMMDQTAISDIVFACIINLNMMVQERVEQEDSAFYQKEDAANVNDGARLVTDEVVQKNAAAGGPVDDNAEERAFKIRRNSFTDKNEFARLKQALLRHINPAIEEE
jgi:hypothetical protein